MRHPNEFDRWLTLERIAFSEFINFTVFENRLAWSGSDDEITDWLSSAIRMFACGGCVDLANAIARDTGSTIAAIRHRGDPVHQIAHAFICDTAKGQGADILGRRPVADIVEEFRTAIGDISIHLIPITEMETLPESDQDELARIGAALPWLPRRRPQTTFIEFRDLVSARAARAA